MAGFSIGATWEEMVAFVRRESALLVPVSLATFGIGAIFTAFALPQEVLAPGATPMLGSRILLMLPALVLLALGNVAVSLLVLTPGSTVGSALQRAAKRLPIIVAAALLLGLVIVAVLIVAVMIMMPLFGAARATVLLTPFAIVLGFAISVPMLMLPSVVAQEPVGPVSALRRCLQLAKGHKGQLVLSLCLLVLITITISAITTLVVTSVVKLLSLVLGYASDLSLIGDILLAGVNALLSMATAVYLACAYRRMTS